MTNPAIAWPTYVGTTPDGPGCGQTAHHDDCLCDVRMPPNHPYGNWMGRLAYASLAEDALLARGIDDPTTLQVVQQMLALRDAIMGALTDLGPALELLAEARMMPTDEQIIAIAGPKSGNKQLDGAATSRARRTHSNMRRAKLQQALTMAPVAVIANALGTTSAAVVGEAYNHAATRVASVVKEALEGQPLDQIAARAHMDGDTLRAMLRIFRVPTLEDRRSKKTADILSLAAQGVSMVAISKKLGVPHDTVRKIAYGQRGPLHSLKVRIDDLVRRGWTAEEIHAEVGADTAIVDRLLGSSKRSNVRLDHLAKTRGPIEKALVAA